MVKIICFGWVDISLVTAIEFNVAIKVVFNQGERIWSLRGSISLWGKLSKHQDKWIKTVLLKYLKIHFKNYIEQRILRTITTLKHSSVSVERQQGKGAQKRGRVLSARIVFFRNHSRFLKHCLHGVWSAYGISIGIKTALK